MLASVALLLAACGGGGGGSRHRPRPRPAARSTSTPRTRSTSTSRRSTPRPAPLTVTLHEKGSQTHTFTIPSEKFEITVTPRKPEATGSVTLKAGTYDFKCSFDGHAAAGMVGKIVVG